MAQQYVRVPTRMLPLSSPSPSSPSPGLPVPWLSRSSQTALEWLEKIIICSQAESPQGSRRGLLQAARGIYIPARKFDSLKNTDACVLLSTRRLHDYTKICIPPEGQSKPSAKVL